MDNSKTSFLKKIYKNPYFKNIGLMFIIFFVLLAITALGLNLYTRHGSYVEVPNVHGLQENEAKSILQAAGLEYVVVDSVYEKKGTPGAIMDQIPVVKAKVKSGRVIYLIIKAKSPQMIVMPDLVDNSYRQAEALLNALGFTNIERQTVNSPYRDLVLGLEYKGKIIKAGTKIPKGSNLVLQVGSGRGDEKEAELTPEIEPGSITDELIEE